MSRTRRLVWTKRMRGTLPSAQVRRPSIRRRTTAATSARAVSGSGARATYSAASSSAPSSTCASGRTGWRAICSASMAAARVPPPLTAGAAPRAPPRLPAGMALMGVRALGRLPIAYGLLTVERVPDEVTDGWVQPFLSQRGVRRDTVKLLRGIDPRELIAAGDKLRDFDRPALLAWGTADRAFKLSLAHRLAERLPRARVEEIKGARTFVAEDQ